MAMKFLARALALGCAALLALAARAADPPARFEISGPFVLGASNAPVTMVEFADYECTFCQRFHVLNFERLKKEFIDTGKVRYMVRDFPLPMHRRAVAAARAARCAAEHGRFWEMRSALLNGSAFDLDSLVEHGEKLGLQPETLRACINSNRHDEAIRRDVMEARRAGVSLTPSFVLGRSRGHEVEGVRLEGAEPYEAYESRIKALLVEAVALRAP